MRIACGAGISRRCVALSSSHLEAVDVWPKLASMVMIESTRDINGVVSREKRYYISSLPPDSSVVVANAIRTHLGIEDQLHWCLDVTFKEHGCGVRIGNAAENFNIAIKITIGLLKRTTSCKLSVAKKRQFATINDSYLAEVLGLRL